MCKNDSVFQTGSSLLDSKAIVHAANQENTIEQDVSRVAEFFSILRDRLQNELPVSAGKQITDEFKQSLIQELEQAQKDNPR